MGSVQRKLVPFSLPLERAASIWCKVLQRWLLMAVTLERLSFAEGIVLARTCSPMVRRQPELRDGGSEELALMGVSTLGDDSIGTIVKPWGRRAMQEGSSPLMASWMESTSMVVYTTKLPDWSVQLSCSISSTFWDELLATCIYVTITYDLE